VSLDFMDKSVKSGKPFFFWHNTTRMHVWTRLSPPLENKSGYDLYADRMMELDWIVGRLLTKLDDLGVSGNTIIVFTSDNGAQKFSWPDGGTAPFRGEKATTWEGGFRVSCLARWPGAGSLAICSVRVAPSVSSLCTVRSMRWAARCFRSALFCMIAIASSALPLKTRFARLAFNLSACHPAAPI
jgi:hypothetical protein